MLSPIRILITEDQYLVAKLLMYQLNADPSFQVVDIIKDGKDTIEFLERTVVDVLLLDIYMNVVDGITVLRQVRDKYPDMKIIMFTSETAGEIVKLAIELGANGYVTKYADCEEIRKGIYSVVGGETYISKLSFKNFMVTMKHGKEHTDNKEQTELLGHNGKNFKNKENINHNKTIEENLTTLTPREKEVLELIIHENTTKSISEKLFISTRTVETHRKNILAKVGCKNSLGLMKYMIANHLGGG